MFRTGRMKGGRREVQGIIKCSAKMKDAHRIRLVYIIHGQDVISNRMNGVNETNSLRLFYVSFTAGNIFYLM